MKRKPHHIEQTRKLVRTVFGLGLLYSLVTILLFFLIRLHIESLSIAMADLPSGAIDQAEILRSNTVQMAAIGILWLAGITLCAGFTIVLTRGLNECERAGLASHGIEAAPEKKGRSGPDTLETIPGGLPPGGIWLAGPRVSATSQPSRKTKGLQLICSACKNVESQSGSWERIEKYVERVTETKFTHGICPRCEQQYYPQAEKTA